MKLFRKMSNRDRSLLILLLAVVVFYLCYTFLMTPALAGAEVLRANIASTQEQIDRANDLKGKVAELKTQEKQMKEEVVKKYSVFLFDLDQARLLKKVDSLMISAGLPPAAYTPSPETPSQVAVEKGAYAPQNYPLKDLAIKINPELQGDINDATQTGAAPADQNTSSEAGVVESADMVPWSELVVGFSNTSYDSIFNFIASVEKMNRSITLKSIDITRSDTGLSGQLVLSCYSIPKIDPAQKDGLDFTPVIPAGKPNPFM